ncbi:failed axon connections homolog [Haliotis cracherodii]|uniref:failed axon connections homolog n=1 Tax=Haliotis cracherodii TaxID=6455 RepID=UPI0039E96445
MESFLETFRNLDTSQKILYVFGGAAVTAVSLAAIRKLTLKEEKRKDYPRDTVILHQIGRGPYAPSMTPFAVKLETYLRMARIPYQNVHGMRPSPKGKVPWIEYNGQPIGDTTLCIQFLNQKLGVDLNKHLSPADKGVAQAMQVMTEEHLYWLLALIRWIYSRDASFILETFKFTKFFLWTIRRHIKKQTWDQGLGRHTEEEIVEMMNKDIQSLSDFIGRKRFLMGDEPSEADCSVFGMLSQTYWQFNGSGYENLIKDEYPNLASYCERMKDAFWPDWGQCITHGGTREATK